jgi:glycosyltransferase involved in cell wall biosynthesis
MKRLILIDPQVSGFEGHFFELASVIGIASIKKGFEPHLIVHNDLPTPANMPVDFVVHRTFSHMKLHKWSLHPEGRSTIDRDLSGAPNGPSVVGRARQFVRDRIHGVRPERMLNDTSDELAGQLNRLKPTSDDLLLASTCDDFTLLAIASAFTKHAPTRPLNLSLLWHMPFQKGREAEFDNGWKAIPHLKRQIDKCTACLSSHNLRFFATTFEIKEILNAATSSDLWKAIDYPIRSDFAPLVAKNTTRPYRVLLGGAQRPEKGKRDLPLAVSMLWPDYLKPGNWSIILQANADYAASLMPNRMKGISDKASDARLAPLVIKPSKLSPEEYLHLIKSADVGLFLYRSRKYYARCSGVLLEMLACGIPVVVPAASWLSRQIAPLVYEHLDLMHRENGMEAVANLLINKPLPSCPGTEDTYRCELRQDSGLLVTLSFTNATHASYVAVEVQTEFHDRLSTCKETRILELGSGFPTRLLLRSKPRQKAVKLKFFSPFGEKHLVLQSAQLSASAAQFGASPTGAVGIIFNGFNDLPRCFAELDDCLSHYSASAVRNADSWRAKHCGDSFVEKLLNEHQLA